MTQLVGSNYIRAATLAAVVLFGAALISVPQGAFPKIAPLLLGFLTLVLAIHCSKTVFDRWMSFAGRMNVFGTALLFGVCYLVVVPVFWAICRVLDPLRLSRKERTSYWIPRAKREMSLRSLQRMA